VNFRASSDSSRLMSRVLSYLGALAASLGGLIHTVASQGWRLFSGGARLGWQGLRARLSRGRKAAVSRDEDDAPMDLPVKVGLYGAGQGFGNSSFGHSSFGAGTFGAGTFGASAAPAGAGSARRSYLYGQGNDGLPARLLAFDQALLGVLVALLAWGLVMVYSATIALPDNPRFAQYGQGMTQHKIALALAVGVGLAAILCCVMPWRWLWAWAWRRSRSAFRWTAGSNSRPGCCWGRCCCWCWSWCRAWGAK
jgi:cell division protein FtsW